MPTCHEGLSGSLWAHAGQTARGRVPVCNKEDEISLDVPCGREDLTVRAAWPSRLQKAVVRDPGGLPWGRTGDPVGMRQVSSARPMPHEPDEPSRPSGSAVGKGAAGLNLSKDCLCALWRASEPAEGRGPR